MPISSEVANVVAKPMLRNTVAKAPQATAKAVVKTGTMADHANFFDTNFDRKITVKETRQGLQDLSFGGAISWVLAPVANLVLGEGLRAPKGSSVFYRLKNLFTVDLDKLAASAKQEAGGAAMDPARKVAGQLKFDTGNQGSLTLDEIGKWVDAEHPGQDNGRTKLGFKQLFAVGADTTKTVTVDGVQKQVPAMSKQALEHFYGGSLFYDIAARKGHPHPQG